jgi:hypothetical protein
MTPHLHNPVNWNLLNIVGDFASYTEKSPSGMGLKIFCKGRLPGRGVKRGDIEIYDQARFFTMTGHCVEDKPCTVEDCNKALNKLYRKVTARDDAKEKRAKARGAGVFDFDDAELLKRARRAKNGADFVALFDRGDTSAYDDDDSRADAALCCYLAFWTRKDAAQMDRLFRRSRLMRDKWDEKHYGDGRTYGRGVIDFAIGNTHEIYEPLKNQRGRNGKQRGHGKETNDGGERRSAADDDPLTHLQKNIMDLSGVEPADVNWIVPELLHKEGITLLTGVPGVGKTTLGVELTIALVNSGLFLSERVKQNKVLWLSFEHSAGSLRLKSDDLAALIQQTIPADRTLILTEPLPLTALTLDAYVEIVQQHEIDAVIVDTLIDWTCLQDLKNAAMVRSAMSLVREFCNRTGAAVLGFMHPPKGASLRHVYAIPDSRIFAAKCDIAAVLDDHIDDPDRFDDPRQVVALRVLKNRHSFGAWVCHLLKQGGRFLRIDEPADDRPRTLPDRVVALIRQRGEIWRQDIIKEFENEISERGMDRLLERLVKRGRLTKRHGENFKAFYSLPDCKGVEPVEGVEGVKPVKPVEPTLTEKPFCVRV